MLFNLVFHCLEIPPFLIITITTTISKFQNIKYLGVTLKCPTHCCLFLKMDTKQNSFHYWAQLNSSDISVQIIITCTFFGTPELRNTVCYPGPVHIPKFALWRHHIFTAMLRHTDEATIWPKHVSLSAPNRVNPLSLTISKCANISFYKYFRGMTSQVEALHDQTF